MEIALDDQFSTVTALIHRACKQKPTLEDLGQIREQIQKLEAPYAGTCLAFRTLLEDFQCTEDLGEEWIEFLSEIDDLAKKQKERSGTVQLEIQKYELFVNICKRWPIEVAQHLVASYKERGQKGLQRINNSAKVWLWEQCKPRLNHLLLIRHEASCRNCLDLSATRVENLSDTAPKILLAEWKILEDFAKSNETDSSMTRDYHGVHLTSENLAHPDDRTMHAWLFNTRGSELLNLLKQKRPLEWTYWALELDEHGLLRRRSRLCAPVLSVMDDVEPLPGALTESVELTGLSTMEDIASFPDDDTVSSTGTYSSGSTPDTEPSETDDGFTSSWLEQGEQHNTFQALCTTADIPEAVHAGGHIDDFSTTFHETPFENDEVVRETQIPRIWFRPRQCIVLAYRIRLSFLQETKARFPNNLENAGIIGSCDSINEIQCQCSDEDQQWLGRCALWANCEAMMNHDTQNRVDVRICDAQRVASILERNLSVPVLCKPDRPDSHHQNVQKVLDRLATNYSDTTVSFASGSRSMWPPMRTSDFVRAVRSGQSMPAADLGNILDPQRPLCMCDRRFALLEHLVEQTENTPGRQMNGIANEVRAQLTSTFLSGPHSISGPYLESVCSVWIHVLDGPIVVSMVLPCRMTAEDWVQFYHAGPTWAPEARARKVRIQRGDILYIPPRTVYSIRTCTATLFTRGFYQDSGTIVSALAACRLAGIDWQCGNDAVTQRLPQIARLLLTMIEQCNLRAGDTETADDDARQAMEWLRHACNDYCGQELDGNVFTLRRKRQRRR